jgi:hypothetical protein
MEGKAGPQSQLKEACIFRMKLAWHSPFRYREIPFDKEEVIRVCVGHALLLFARQSVLSRWDLNLWTRLQH